MDKKDIVVTLANKTYINQAKQLFSGVYWNAGWKGDYMLLAHEIPETELKWFRDKGILVNHCNSLIDMDRKIHPAHQIDISKFYLFSEKFKQWKTVVYLDVDILVRASIDDLIYVNGFAACRDFSWVALGDNIIIKDHKGENKYNLLKKRYDLHSAAFNGGVMAFNTDIIKKDTLGNLKAMAEEYITISRYLADQLVLNLFFYKNWKRIPEVYNCRYIKTAAEYFTPEKNMAIIIHVTGDQRPWDLANSLYKEWRDNLDKAEHIDLTNIPSPQKWSKERIQKNSNIIIIKQLLGFQKPSFITVSKVLFRIFSTFITDFPRALEKSKDLARDLLRL